MTGAPDASEPTVLVVDDAPDIRLLMREVLRHSGFVVTEAEDGSEALTVLAAGELPAVVVLDVQMPGVDGWATLAALPRRSPHCRRARGAVHRPLAPDRPAAGVGAGMRRIPW